MYSSCMTSSSTEGALCERLERFPFSVPPMVDPTAKINGIYDGVSHVVAPPMPGPTTQSTTGYVVSEVISVSRNISKAKVSGCLIIISAFSLPLKIHGVDLCEAQIAESLDIKVPIAVCK